MVSIQVIPLKVSIQVIPLKEDSAASERLFYTSKNQSAQTYPMTSELENHSLRAPIDLLTENIKIISESYSCRSFETILSENFKMNKAFEKINFQDPHSYQLV